MRFINRAAFTLIELLVVIAIIAVLVALTAAAVIPLIFKGPELVTRNEIGQMEVGLTSMQTEFKLRNPPPSLLYLSNNRNDYTDPALPYPNLRRDSLAHISRMFPRLNWTAVNWGLPTQGAARGVILEGDQSLVFHLGGPDGISGFSTDPSNPTNMATESRKGPYYEFNKGRLEALPAKSSAAIISRSTSALSYVDGFKGQSLAPYLYFSSGNRTYNTYGASTPDAYGSDCKSLDTPAVAHLSSGVMPYFQSSSPLRYLSPKGVQIISAGLDGKFGPGGLWNPAQPTVTKEGRDDLASFSPNQLQAAQ